MRGKRPDFDLSRGRPSGAGGDLAPNACATSMISGFGGPPDPRVLLTPFVVSTCAEGRRRRRGLDHACRGVRGVELRRRGHSFNFRHRERLAFDWKIWSWEHNEAERRSRESRRPSRHSSWALVPHGQRRCAARNKTERLVQFVPHFSRRPLAPNASESRMNLVPAYSRSPAQDTRIQAVRASFRFFALIRVDPDLTIVQKSDPTGEVVSMARNVITDVEGVLVGSAEDERLASGVTVVLFEEPAIASIAMNGGAPALRDTALLEPEMTIERVDGFVLSGRVGFRTRRRGRRYDLSRWRSVAASSIAEPAFRSCRARACSIFSTAATNPGAASRPTGTWASKLRRPPQSISHLAPRAQDLARRPTT